MAYALGTKSRERLVGVHQDLVRVVERAIEITTQDFMVLEGVRSQERQDELYAQGRTKPGPIVTWVKVGTHTNGTAVDLVPFPVDWNDLSKFDAISKAMFQAAKEQGVRIRWGADWNQNGTARERGESDSPHFELA